MPYGGEEQQFARRSERPEMRICVAHCEVMAPLRPSWLLQPPQLAYSHYWRFVRLTAGLPAQRMVRLVSMASLNVSSITVSNGESSRSAEGGFGSAARYPQYGSGVWYFPNAYHLGGFLRTCNIRTGGKRAFGKISAQRMARYVEHSMLLRTASLCQCMPWKWICAALVT